MKLTGKTTPELLEMQRVIESDPANQNPVGSFFLYTPKTVKKLDKIREQIAYNMSEKRKALGLPINQDGYSGRKSNRR